MKRTPLALFALFALFAFLALAAVGHPAAADSSKRPATTAPSVPIPQPAMRNALKPDLAVSLSPDLPGQWPMHFAVVNIGGSKSEDEYLRIGVFVVGEDPVTKKSCVPRYTGSDTLIKGLKPTESVVVQPSGFATANVKYMPAPPNAPPPVPHDGVIKCAFQVGASLADAGKNDANYANDSIVKNLTFTMPVKP